MPSSVPLAASQMAVAIAGPSNHNNNTPGPLSQVTSAHHHNLLPNSITALPPATPVQTAASISHPDPDTLVFPPPSSLPDFFPTLTSVGLNLSLSCARLDLCTFTLYELSQWARRILQPKFEKQIPPILERFPNLEVLFLTIREHGRSNSDWGTWIEKRHWKEVELAVAEEGRWGRRECEVLEMEMRRWLCGECTRMGRLMMKFELCVQWDSMTQ